MSTNTLVPRTGKGSKPGWSEMELDLLKRFYPSISARDIARKLHRTTRAVTCMAHRMGVRKSHERLREMGSSNVLIRWRSGGAG